MNLKSGVFICVVAIFFLVVPAAADNNNSMDNNTATIYGRVYSMVTFEPMDNAVVSINSTPFQSMVATVGVYSFELAPGNYTITAKYYENGTITYSVDDTVNIINKGTYVHDLLLLSVYSEELMNSSGSNGSLNNSVLSTGNSSTGVSKTNNPKNVNATRDSAFYSPSTSYFLIGLISLVLLSAAGYQLFGSNKKKGKSPGDVKIAHRIKDFSSSANSNEAPLKTPDKNLYPEQGMNFLAHTEVPVSVTDHEETDHEETDHVETDHVETDHVETDHVETGPKTSVIEPITESEFVRLGVERKAENVEIFSTQETQLQEPESKDESRGTSLKKPELNPETDIQDPKKKLPLPSDLQEVIDIIRGQRGRITQKELCGRLKCSDAKVSLMLADLERRNLIEKFKKGRGNVVVLKDEKH